MSYPYTISGSSIKIRSNWTNQVACCRMSNGLFQDEVNETFTGSTGFTLSGNTLILRDAKGNEKVRMVRESSGSSCDAIDGEWTAIQVRGKTVNVNITISKTAISYKYCNGKSMTYTTRSGNQIEFTPGMSTMMACMGLNPTEGEFDSGFSSAVRYERVGNQVRFYDQKGALTITLQSRGSVVTPVPTPVTQSIVGVWTTSTVGDRSLSFVVNISSNTLSFSYCNTFSFPYSTSGNKISFKTPGATKMYCANMNPPESFVSATFSSATTFSVSKTYLIFYDSLGKVVVRMTAGDNTGVVKPIPPFTQSLVGDWFTTSVNGNKVIITVTISTDQIRYTYCNGKSLPYKSSGNDISIRSGISTLMYCEGLKPSEGEVDSAFTSAVSFKLSGNQLCLIDKGGNVVVTLEREQVYRITPIFDKHVLAI